MVRAGFYWAGRGSCLSASHPCGKVSSSAAPHQKLCRIPRDRPSCLTSTPWGATSQDLSHLGKEHSKVERLAELMVL